MAKKTSARITIAELKEVAAAQRQRIEKLEQIADDLELCVNSLNSDMRAAETVNEAIGKDLRDCKVEMLSLETERLFLDDRNKKHREVLRKQAKQIEKLKAKNNCHRKLCLDAMRGRG